MYFFVTLRQTAGSLSGLRPSLTHIVFGISTASAMSRVLASGTTSSAPRSNGQTGLFWSSPPPR